MTECDIAFIGPYAKMSSDTSSTYDRFICTTVTSELDQCIARHVDVIQLLILIDSKRKKVEFPAGLCLALLLLWRLELLSHMIVMDLHI